jgi:hypothetical protein
VSASYRRHYAELRPFPDASAMAYLRSLRVTHVVVHSRAFVDAVGQERASRVEGTPGLRLTLRSGDLSVYKLEP